MPAAAGTSRRRVEYQFLVAACLGSCRALAALVWPYKRRIYTYIYISSRCVSLAGSTTVLHSDFRRGVVSQSRYWASALCRKQQDKQQARAGFATWGTRIHWFCATPDPPEVTVPVWKNAREGQRQRTPAPQNVFDLRVQQISLNPQGCRSEIVLQKAFDDVRVRRLQRVCGPEPPRVLGNLSSALIATTRLGQNRWAVLRHCVTTRREGQRLLAENSCWLWECLRFQRVLGSEQAEIYRSDLWCGLADLKRRRPKPAENPTTQEKRCADFNDPSSRTETTSFATWECADFNDSWQLKGENSCDLRACADFNDSGRTSNENYVRLARDLRIFQRLWAKSCRCSRLDRACISTTLAESWECELELFPEFESDFGWNSREFVTWECADFNDFGLKSLLTSCHLPQTSVWFVTHRWPNMLRISHLRLRRCQRLWAKSLRFLRLAILRRAGVSPTT